MVSSVVHQRAKKWPWSGQHSYCKFDAGKKVRAHEIDFDTTRATLDAHDCTVNQKQNLTLVCQSTMTTNGELNGGPVLHKIFDTILVLDFAKAYQR
jgi:hypothetical protein